jgi:histidine triad (HIT) family protein
MPCVFCQIVERKKPAKIFSEDEDIIVFADILPRANIHLLVCPKRHFESLLELPNELLIKSMETAKDIARRLSIEDNFRIVLNNGAKAGQIIEHLHFHFISNAAGVDVVYRN